MQQYGHEEPPLAFDRRTVHHLHIMRFGQRFGGGTIRDKAPLA